MAAALSSAPAKLRESIGDDKGALAALAFLEGFVPRAGVDYAWVADVTKDRWAAVLETLSTLDEKSTSVVNFVSSGAGLFTLGSLAGIAGGSVPPTVIASAIPAMLCAIAALVYATRARAPSQLEMPRGMPQAVDFAHFHSDAKMAQANYFAHWPLSIALGVKEARRKAALLRISMKWVVAAVGLLLVPVLTSICVAATRGEPRPLSVILHHANQDAAPIPKASD